MKKPTVYNITPAKGQALLKFQGRLMPDKIEAFETQIVEEIRQKGQQKIETEKQTDPYADFRNLLIHGDCLSACAYLKSQNIKVDLVYIDPPFASGANYTKKIYLRNGGKTSIENEDNAIGEEIMYSDIWQKEDYLNWLYERLLAIREIMSEKASIYVHLDWHIGAYGRVLMDEVFGEENFANEIIWAYSTQGRPEDKFARKHDTILWYVNNPEDYYFDIKNTKVPYSKNYIKTHFKDKDKDGRVCRIRTEYGKTRIYYPEEGMIPNDVWIDVYYENPMSKARTDYTTQKPEALLKRIIKASSDKGMLIADFFCGSGTTPKVAYDLDRKFIACDIGMNAIQTTRDRLVKAEAEFDILKIKEGIRLFRNPAQTTAKIFSLIGGFKNRTELELGEFWDGGIVGEKGTYVPVKFIGIDKKLTKELVDVILEEIYQLEDTGNETEAVKLVYAHKDLEINQSYVNNEIRRAGKSNINVQLISLDELLDQKADVLFTPDNADVEVTKEENRYKVEIKHFFSSYLKNKIDEFNAKKVNKLTQETSDGNPIQLSEAGLELIEAVQFDTTLKKDENGNNVWTSNLSLEDKAGVKEKIKGVYYLPTNKFNMKIRNIAGDEIIIDSKDLK